MVALSEYLIASGATAMRDEITAERFGMTGGGGMAEGYVMAGDAQALADSFCLVEDPEGNTIIHEVELEEPFTGYRAPVAAVAVDLMRSLATRERNAGQRVIDDLLANFLSDFNRDTRLLPDSEPPTASGIECPLTLAPS